MSDIDEGLAARIAEQFQQMRLDARELAAAARTSARLSRFAGEATRALPFEAEPSDWLKARRDWQGGDR
jgi:hypothetical protein